MHAHVKVTPVLQEFLHLLLRSSREEQFETIFLKSKSLNFEANHGVEPQKHFTAVINARPWYAGVFFSQPAISPVAQYLRVRLESGVSKGAPVA
jgi:hypothetical protein